MFYAVGLALVRRDAAADTGEKFQVKSIFNTGTIAAILVMIIFFGKVALPDVVVAPLSFVGSLTMPLSMMIIGANMAQYRMREVFANKRMYALAVMRLVIVPLLVAEDGSRMKANVSRQAPGHRHRPLKRFRSPRK